MADISKIKLPDNSEYEIKDAKARMVILRYGTSTWQDFIDAYNNNCVVYCRASSNSNPASGSQTRLAFMAYVSNAETPTNVEFQYYRSVNAHSASQMGDQVYVYKLTNANKWTVTTRECSPKIVAGTNMSSSYSSDVLTLNATSPFTDIIDTLTAGSTSITLSDSSITTSSTIDVYTDSWGINPTAISVSTGSVALTFEAQQSDLGVKVRIS